MNGLTFEKMTRQHIPEVQALERACFDNTWPEDAFLNEIERNGAACYLVALQGGQVLGYAGAWLILDEMHITSVAVRPESRGKGIGKRLFWHLMQEAVDHGCEWSGLEVRPTSQPAIALYEAFGFTRVGVRKRYYDGKDDALVMWVGGLQASEYARRMEALRSTRESAEVRP